VVAVDKLASEQHADKGAFLGFASRFLPVETSHLFLGDCLGFVA